MKVANLCFAFLCSFTLNAATAELQWCLDNYPHQHEYPINGKPYGPTVELMQELARRAGFSLQFSTNTPFARCLKLMQDGKTDLMVRLNYSEQRSGFMHLIPYAFAARPELIYILATAQDITELSQLKRLTLGVIRGYTYNSDIATYLLKHHKPLVELDSEESAIAMLLHQRIDAVIAPLQQDISPHHDAPQHVEANGVKVASLALPFASDKYLHIGFSKKSQHQALLNQLQQAVISMQQDGFIDALISGTNMPQHDTTKDSMHHP